MPIFEAAVDVGCGFGEVEEINLKGIREVWTRAVRRAVCMCKSIPNLTYLDGEITPEGLTDILGGKLIVEPKADANYWQCSAASILAKVIRDHEMITLAKRYPGYGWERNKGYPTPEHKQGVARLGATPIHRIQFLKGIDAFYKPKSPKPMKMPRGRFV